MNTFFSKNFSYIKKFSGASRRKKKYNRCYLYSKKISAKKIAPRAKNFQQKNTTPIETFSAKKIASRANKFQQKQSHPALKVFTVLKMFFWTHIFDSSALPFGYSTIGLV
jgi:hypothetical protein